MDSLCTESAVSMMVPECLEELESIPPESTNGVRDEQENSNGREFAVNVPSETRPPLHLSDYTRVFERKSLYAEHYKLLHPLATVRDHIFWKPRDFEVNFVLVLVSALVCLVPAVVALFWGGLATGGQGGIGAGPSHVSVALCAILGGCVGLAGYRFLLHFEFLVLYSGMLGGVSAVLFSLGIPNEGLPIIVYLLVGFAIVEGFRIFLHLAALLAFGSNRSRRGGGCSAASVAVGRCGSLPLSVAELKAFREREGGKDKKEPQGETRAGEGAEEKPYRLSFGQFALGLLGPHTVIRFTDTVRVGFLRVACLSAFYWVLFCTQSLFPPEASGGVIALHSLAVAALRIACHLLPVCIWWASGLSEQVGAHDQVLSPTSLASACAGALVSKMIASRGDLSWSSFGGLCAEEVIVSFIFGLVPSPDSLASPFPWKSPRGQMKKDRGKGKEGAHGGGTAGVTDIGWDDTIESALTPYRVKYIQGSFGQVDPSSSRNAAGGGGTGGGRGGGGRFLAWNSSEREAFSAVSPVGHQANPSEEGTGGGGRVRGEKTEEASVMRVPRGGVWRLQVRFEELFERQLSLFLYLILRTGVAVCVAFLALTIVCWGAFEAEREPGSLASVLASAVLLEGGGEKGDKETVGIVFGRLGILLVLDWVTFCFVILVRKAVFFSRLPNEYATLLAARFIPLSQRVFQDPKSRSDYEQHMQRQRERTHLKRQQQQQQLRAAFMHVGRSGRQRSRSSGSLSGGAGAGLQGGRRASWPRGEKGRHGEGQKRRRSSGEPSGRPGGSEGLFEVPVSGREEARDKEPIWNPWEAGRQAAAQAERERTAEAQTCSETLNNLSQTRNADDRDGLDTPKHSNSPHTIRTRPTNLRLPPIERHAKRAGSRNDGLTPASSACSSDQERESGNQTNTRRPKGTWMSGPPPASPAVSHDKLTRLSPTGGVLNPLSDSQAAAPTSADIVHLEDIAIHGARPPTAGSTKDSPAPPTPFPFSSADDPQTMFLNEAEDSLSEVVAFFVEETNKIEGPVSSQADRDRDDGDDSSEVPEDWGLSKHLIIKIEGAKNNKAGESPHLQKRNPFSHTPTNEYSVPLPPACFASLSNSLQQQHRTHSEHLDESHTHSRPKMPPCLLPVKGETPPSSPACAPKGDPSLIRNANSCNLRVPPTETIQWGHSSNTPSRPPSSEKEALAPPAFQPLIYEVRHFSFPHHKTWSESSHRDRETPLRILTQSSRSFSTLRDEEERLDRAAASYTQSSEAFEDPSPTPFTRLARCVQSAGSHSAGLPDANGVPTAPPPDSYGDVPSEGHPIPSHIPNITDSGSRKQQQHEQRGNGKSQKADVCIPFDKKSSSSLSSLSSGSPSHAAAASKKNVTKSRGATGCGGATGRGPNRESSLSPRSPVPSFPFPRDPSEVPSSPRRKDTDNLTRALTWTWTGIRSAHEARGPVGGRGIWGRQRGGVRSPRRARGPRVLQGGRQKAVRNERWYGPDGQMLNGMFDTQLGFAPLFRGRPCVFLQQSATEKESTADSDPLTVEWLATHNRFGQTEPRRPKHTRQANQSGKTTEERSGLGRFPRGEKERKVCSDAERQKEAREATKEWRAWRRAEALAAFLTFSGVSRSFSTTRMQDGSVPVMHPVKRLARFEFIVEFASSFQAVFANGKEAWKCDETFPAYLVVLLRSACRY
uniref:Transmembrane protein n=1 Tax=Chromera velia CCMP2878 TaxID=1169474 RepID=A0A0G4GLN6_9ALVE|eukprot:Cvel_22462.t1-p1 / transcript=Cvel_22462.t1 / gene=Cvel_22462 / organism=Chromera_velia_CCMP2878 / gene_product=hypothetical protein / transcript_product=hypothetical protein / location=Cvel_scaffold2209:23377-30543(+) / protein_length=1673 / sequence_SO=supercontig / SO=protein_coding / is_pseudo=false